MDAKHCTPRRRTLARVVTTIIAASLWPALLPSPAAGQSGRTTILVGTGDAEIGVFLPAVQVHIVGLDIAQVTDSMGRARLAGVRGGTYTIEAKRLGYAPLTAPFVVRAEDSLEVILLLRSTARRLDTVSVAASPVLKHLADFEKRRARGTGQFVTGTQIDSMQGSSFKSILESHVRGLTAVGGDGGMHVMTGRMATEASLRPGSGAAGPCWPVIYLDGVQLTDDTGRGPDIGFINPMSVGGIEFYEPSEVPVEYRSSGVLQNQRALGASGVVGGRGGSQAAVGATSTPSCGAVLLWSRG